MNSLDVPAGARTSNKPPIPKVLGVGGSPRKNGNSDVLLRHILDGARKKGVPSRIGGAEFKSGGIKIGVLF